MKMTLTVIYISKSVGLNDLEMPDFTKYRRIATMS